MRKSCLVSNLIEGNVWVVTYQGEFNGESGERGPEKLDFPKGKADEGETDVECAVREINEEIGFNIKPFINEDHYIKIETIQGKFVKLFLVSDIEEAQILKAFQTLKASNPYASKKYSEAFKIVWIETS